MMRRPQIAMLPDGRRLHLQDGPIDLVIEADGEVEEVRRAHAAAIERFTGLLDELCAELPELRRAAEPGRAALTGTVARRMQAAVAPHSADGFITPMAAVAGAVAEEILQAMTEAASLERAYVNNGGDIALHLRPGRAFSIGIMDRPDASGVLLPISVDAGQTARGIATSGRHGRSFSLGIADAVTVLAATAAQADAAATVVANAVDLPDHAAITRCPACDIQPDSDLGPRLVTRSVGQLTDGEVGRALDSGAAQARQLLARGLIEGAVLRLNGAFRTVGIRDVNPAGRAAAHVMLEEA